MAVSFVSIDSFCNVLLGDFRHDYEPVVIIKITVTNKSIFSEALVNKQDALSKNKRNLFTLSPQIKISIKH